MDLMTSRAQDAAVAGLGKRRAPRALTAPTLSANYYELDLLFIIPQ